MSGPIVVSSFRRIQISAFTSLGKFHFLKPDSISTRRGQTALSRICQEDAPVGA